MTEEDIENAKRRMFGDKAHLAAYEKSGSGISTTHTISMPVLEDIERFNAGIEPWLEHRQLIQSWYQPFLETYRQCPGRKKPQCSQSASDKPCWPNWRRRQDPQWYALKLKQLVDSIDGRLLVNHAASVANAVDEAFEAGSLLTEALNLFGWGKFAQTGKRVHLGGAKAAEMRTQKFPSDEDILTEVREAMKTLRFWRPACRAVAKKYGMAADSVRKKCDRARKPRS